MRVSDSIHGLPRGASVDDLQPLIGILDEDSARQMKEAIAEGCGRGLRHEG